MLFSPPMSAVHAIAQLGGGMFISLESPALESTAIGAVLTSCAGMRPLRAKPYPILRVRFLFKPRL
jgi:hypothetical protein